MSRRARKQTRAIFPHAGQAAVAGQWCATILLVRVSRAGPIGGLAFGRQAAHIPEPVPAASLPRAPLPRPSCPPIGPHAGAEGAEAARVVAKEAMPGCCSRPRRP